MKTNVFFGEYQNRGAVLLEVVLALVLFVMAAAIITGGMNSSLDGLERQKRNLHAANLAVSSLSEIQLGMRSPQSGGAMPLEAPFTNWTSETVTTTLSGDGESAGPVLVEVIIRNLEFPLVYRLGQIMKLPATNEVTSVSENSLDF